MPDDVYYVHYHQLGRWRCVATKYGYNNALDMVHPHPLEVRQPLYPTRIVHHGIIVAEVLGE